MLRPIELAQHGIFLPFVFHSKRAKYGFTVTADHTDRVNRHPWFVRPTYESLRRPSQHAKPNPLIRSRSNCPLTYHPWGSGSMVLNL
jgi:hypothetical protein